MRANVKNKKPEKLKRVANFDVNVNCYKIRDSRELLQLGWSSLGCAALAGR